MHQSGVDVGAQSLKVPLQRRKLRPPGWPKNAVGQVFPCRCNTTVEVLQRSAWLPLLDRTPDVQPKDAICRYKGRSSEPGFCEKADQ